MSARTRRRGALLAASALTFGLLGAVGSGADAAKGTGNKNLVQVQLLTFNDYHGYLESPSGGDNTLGAALDPTNTPVGGVEYLSTTLKNLRAGHDRTVTATAGDLIGGSPFLSGLFHDEPSVESLETLGLDVSGVGNHEFDEGLPELLRMQHGGCHPVDGCYFPNAPYDGANFPWLAANVVHTDTGKTVLPGTWVKNLNGVKVGFIGMTLEDTPALVAQSGIEGLTFQDEIEAGNRAAEKLKRQGVKTIVVLIHEGGLQTGTFDGCTGISGPIVQIAEGLDDDIDLIVSGHTHQPYVCNIPDPEGEPRLVTSASSFGRVVTETLLTVNIKSGEVKRELSTATNHLVTRTVPKDPAETAVIAKWSALSGPIGNRIVGTITADIRRSQTRATESSLANLVADTQLWATQASPANAQIAFMNPGGVRTDLTYASSPKGEGDGNVTYAESFAVQPFGNIVVTMTMTGADIDAVLEQQYVVGRPGGRDTLILGISKGLTFDWSVSGAAGSRVSNIQLNGVPIDPAANYQVSLNNFLADGNDGFTVFKNGTNRIGGGDDVAVFNDYLKAFGPVAPPATDRINELP